MKVRLPGRVGVFSIGHAPYWPQFPALKERLLGHYRVFVERLRAAGAEVFEAGFADDGESGRAVGERLRGQPVDLVFCYIATYATSAAAIPALQRGGAPAVLVGLQPTPCMDMDKATTELQLEHDNVTSMPEIAGAMIRCGIPPAAMVVGTLHDDPRAEREVGEWLQVAAVRRAVHDARIGYLGHTYEGMLDMHSDPTMFHGAFGLHVQMLEMCDLKQLADEVTEGEIDAKVADIRGRFVFPPPGADPIAGPAKEEDLRWSARVAIATERLIAAYRLTALAYYYRGLDNNEYERLAAGMIVGNSILTGEGVPVAGEADLKNCLAMLILDRLGAGGSYAEFHPVDFPDDVVLVGHDGPAHLAISDQKPILRGLSVYHGKRGAGVSVEFKVRTGPATILGVGQTRDGRFKLIAAHGESLPGKIPATGNTNTRMRFEPDVRTFLERWSSEGPTHHFALGVGHVIPAIEKLTRSWGMELAVVAR